MYGMLREKCFRKGLCLAHRFALRLQAAYPQSQRRGASSPPLMQRLSFPHSSEFLAALKDVRIEYNRVRNLGKRQTKPLVLR